METYYIEYNGEHFQSVFPSVESEKSKLHDTMLDAYNYFTKECGVKKEDIIFNLGLYIKQKVSKQMIALAGGILLDENDNIMDQLLLIIIEYGMGREIDTLDHVEGVQTVEQFEYVFSVKDFLEHVGFDEYKPIYHSVQDVIDMLEKVKDKTKPAFAYGNDELFDIVDVDYCILDRVDINIKRQE